MRDESEAKVRMIPVDRIQVLNPRVRDKTKFDQIVENIRAIGLKRPITVTVGKADAEGQPTFNLVCGQGRLEAFIALGQPEIPAFVRGFTQSESLLASLIENIARRRGNALANIRTIQWMKEQGHSPEDIGAKTGLTPDYVKTILGLLQHGEDRLLDAVVHGRMPITIATQIAENTDEDAQRLLMAAYERKELNHRSVRHFRRILEIRRNFGKDYGKRQSRGGPLTTAESLVRAYRLESQRQKVMVRKAKVCEAKLLSVAAAFRVLLTDEDYVNLLRAEDLHTMPKFLAERARLAG